MPTIRLSRTPVFGYFSVTSHTTRRDRFGPNQTIILQSCAPFRCALGPSLPQQPPLAARHAADARHNQL